mgnify:FL=1
MTQQLHPWQNNEKFRSLDPKKQEMILQNRRNGISSCRHPQQTGEGKTTE